jgi:8-oxo-dGTP pyrophosphatase MutT (NUDIX family)
MNGRRLSYYTYTGESLEEPYNCARREFMEETGVRIPLFNFSISVQKCIFYPVLLPTYMISSITLYRTREISKVTLCTIHDILHHNEFLPDTNYLSKKLMQKIIKL